MSEDENDPTDAPAPAFDTGNFLFGFLGAWCALVIGFMVYAPEAKAPSSRSPAQVPLEPSPTEPFDPRAYFLSFNSIHLEK